MRTEENEKRSDFFGLLEEGLFSNWIGGEEGSEACPEGRERLKSRKGGGRRVFTLFGDEEGTYMGRKNRLMKEED